ncbi:FAD-dependent oxidoreductase [Nonomuraea rubra]|uniref:FAD-dependent oxidoreductase n=1 Tax=Nonomuraea rubra TaxID=46180 RepID=UPI0033E2E664
MPAVRQIGRKQAGTDRPAAGTPTRARIRANAWNPRLDRLFSQVEGVWSAARVGVLVAMRLNHRRPEMLLDERGVSALPDLPTADFTFDPHQPGACVAGLRPYRVNSYRLEGETLGDKFVLHNYGHGGGGITLSWGCAARVRDLVLTHQRRSKVVERDIAVIGAGVMGLTAATLLLDLGLNVTIYSDRKPVETTSYKAGGQWAVSLLEFSKNFDKVRELQYILRTAYTMFKAAIGKGFGVSEVDNYSVNATSGIDVVHDLVPGLLPQREYLQRLPFEGHNVSGYRYRTLLVEPPIFIPRLERDLKARGVTFVNRKFINSADVLTSLTQKIIINCTGLGAKNLWNDSDMFPLRGQLAMLRPQPNLEYLYGQNGYLFPRNDHVVIGGTVEETCDEAFDPVKCQELVGYMAGVFGQRSPEPMPEFFIHHPRNEVLVDPRLSISP